MTDYYKVLEVEKNATQDQIKKAFRDLSKKYHPDRNGGDDTKFKEINEAYSVLGDEQKKKEYDMKSSGFGSWGGFNPYGTYRQMASDLQTQITVSLEDAYNGCSVPIRINGRIFSVDIPKGTTNGKLLKINGMGQRGYNIYGQEAVGDLIVKVLVRQDDKMWLNDTGLLEVMTGVEWIDAILGGEMEVKVFDRTVKVRIPKYTQNGGYTIVGGQGFRQFKSDKLGNLKVNFVVRMPKSLTDSQLEGLRKIKESL